MDEKNRFDMILIQNDATDRSQTRGYLAVTEYGVEDDTRAYGILYLNDIDNYPAIRDAILRHELLHVELAKYLKKKITFSTKELDKIRDEISKIYEELRFKIREYSDKIEDENERRYFDELWGTGLDYYRDHDDEEALAHLLSVAYLIYYYTHEPKYYLKVLDIINSLRKKKYNIEHHPTNEEYEMMKKELEEEILSAGNSEKEDWNIFKRF